MKQVFVELVTASKAAIVGRRISTQAFSLHGDLSQTPMSNKSCCRPERRLETLLLIRNLSTGAIDSNLLVTSYTTFVVDGSVFETSSIVKASKGKESLNDFRSKYGFHSMVHALMSTDRIPSQRSVKCSEMAFFRCFIAAQLVQSSNTRLHRRRCATNCNTVLLQYL